MTKDNNNIDTEYMNCMITYQQNKTDTKINFNNQLRPKILAHKGDNLLKDYYQFMMVNNPR